MKLYNWLLINFFCGFCCIVYAEQPSFERSYGSWAAEKVPQVLQINNDLVNDILKEEFIPCKDKRMSDLRVTVENARNILDVFAYAYPNAGKRHDQFLKTRKELNILHRSVGHYKDMDRQTPEGQQRKAFSNIKNQLNVYYTDVTNPKTIDYLSNPLKDSFQYRKRRKLSKMIWGSQPEDLPTLDYTGLGNIELIFQNLIQDIILKWLQVKNTTADQFEKDEGHLERYHLIRKRLRIVLFLFQEFSIFIFSQPESGKEIIDNIVSPFIKDIGKVKTSYEKYWKAKKKGNTPKADKYKAEGRQRLKDLNEKLAKQSVEQDITTNLRQLNAQTYPIDDFYNKEKTNTDTFFYIFVIFLALLTLVGVSAAFSFYWTKLYHENDGYQSIVESY